MFRIFPRCTSFDKVRAAASGEIVYVWLVVGTGGRSICFLAPLPFDPGSPIRPSTRHRQPNIVGAEIGKELGRGVKLMAVPAAVLEDADLRKPLRDEKEIS